MASSAASRTGLITATVILTIVTLTALVAAFIFSAQARRNARELSELERAYNGIIQRRNLSSQAVVAIRDRARQGELVFDAAVRERDELARLVGGQEPAAAMAAAEQALTRAAEVMRAANLPEPSTTENMAGTVTQLANAVASLSAQVEDLTRTANEAQARAAAAVENATRQLAAKDEQIAQVRAEATSAIAAAQRDRMDRQGVVDEVNRLMEQERAAAAQAMQQLTMRLADSERTRVRLERDVSSAMAKLAMFRPDAAQSTIRAADGTIARVSTDSIVYIDLGAGQQIVPGMTFEVYDKVEGVPPLRTGENELPMGKASIEVIRVGPTSSEARVIRVTPGRTITEGDVIANLIYDRNTRYNFVVFGKFDLTRPGTPDAADARILRRLVSEWGGRVQDQIDVTTDFLVIGAEPQIPDFTEEQRRDPVNAKLLIDAQAELDAYNEVLRRAQELSIPVLNQNRFLYFIGYFEQARR